MNKVKYVIRYFVDKYPYKEELSKTRITKMVYLADWYSSLKHERQITKIEWYFDHYGPYVPDVYETALKDKQLDIRTVSSFFGTPKSLVTLNNDKVTPMVRLKKEEIEILDEVINNTKHLTWNAFIDYVYGTYPIKKGQKYKSLDLVRYAKIAKKEK